VIGPGTEDLLVPQGHYVLVKRFSTKEERRRVVAAVYDPERVPSDRVAFENHLNYYHIRGSGLPVTIAKGLAAFLNSTLVDSYFRQFSGHTQVNAADLRSFRYPARDKLVAIGRRIGKNFPDQQELDRLVGEVINRG
jgi:adenine-specific DNA-methyltransferase